MEGIMETFNEIAGREFVNISTITKADTRTLNPNGINDYGYPVAICLILKLF